MDHRALGGFTGLNPRAHKNQGINFLVFLLQPYESKVLRSTKPLILFFEKERNALACGFVLIGVLKI